MKPIFNFNNLPKIINWNFENSETALLLLFYFIYLFIWIIRIFPECPTFLGVELKICNVSNMPNIIVQINSKTAQIVLSILEIFYQNFFRALGFFQSAQFFLGRSEISFNLYNLPEIIRLHKIPIMAKTHLSIQEKNSQEISAKCPIVFGKMGKKSKL
jgi:hypothetical protein